MHSRTPSCHLAAVILAGALACGGGGGGGGGGPGVPGHQASAESATKLAGLGDSMMEAYDAGGALEQRENSFAQGTTDAVFSLYSRYSLVSGLPDGKEFASRTGDTMIDDGLRQATLVCGQSPKPDRIVILLGANDACDLRTPADFGAALKSVLDRLASARDCGLPAGTRVHVLSVPRVDYLAQVVSPSKCLANGPQIACNKATGTPEALRLLAHTVLGYNEAIGKAVDAANVTYHLKDGDIWFSTDWIGSTPANSSIATYAFTASDVSTLDCFHPSVEGQRRLACAAWESWEGLGDVAGCFQ